MRELVKRKKPAAIIQITDPVAESRYVCRVCAHFVNPRGCTNFVADECGGHSNPELGSRVRYAMVLDNDKRLIGSPDPLPLDPDDPDLNVIAANAVLARCITAESGCWEWQGATSQKGYGRVKFSNRLLSPHRVVAVAAGIIPNINVLRIDQNILHSCDNPKCCNPAHLSAGSLAENMQDCARKGRVRNQARQSD